MIKEKLIPRESDKESIKAYAKEVQKINRAVEEILSKKENAREQIEDLQKQLQNMEMNISIDSADKDIAKLKANKTKILAEIEDKEILLSIDVNEYTRTKINSEEFQQLRSKASNNYEEITRPLIIERDRMKKEHKEDMDRFDMLIFKNEYNRARQLEVLVKHKI